jgi:hypothetical protein
MSPEQESGPAGPAVVFRIVRHPRALGTSRPPWHPAGATGEGWQGFATRFGAGSTERNAARKHRRAQTSDHLLSFAVGTGSWCSGLTCQPVTLETAGSNPVEPAIAHSRRIAPLRSPLGVASRPRHPWRGSGSLFRPKRHRSGFAAHALTRSARVLATCQWGRPEVRSRRRMDASRTGFAAGSPRFGLRRRTSRGGSDGIAPPRAEQGRAALPRVARADVWHVAVGRPQPFPAGPSRSRDLYSTGSPGRAPPDRPQQPAGCS